MSFEVGQNLTHALNRSLGESCFENIPGGMDTELTKTASGMMPGFLS